MKKNSQEEFWESDFGDQYKNRNQSLNIYASNIKLFSEIFYKLNHKPTSIVEFGSNLKANKIICTDCTYKVL